MRWFDAVSCRCKWHRHDAAEMNEHAETRCEREEVAG